MVDRCRPCSILRVLCAETDVARIGACCNAQAVSRSRTRCMYAMIILTLVPRVAAEAAIAFTSQEDVVFGVLRELVGQAEWLRNYVVLFCRLQVRRPAEHTSC